MEETKKTITAFCAGEQKETEHSLDIDVNGEVLITCESNLGTEQEPISCGRFVKFPKGTTVVSLKESLAKHKEVNEGQLPIEMLEKEKESLIDGINNQVL